MRRLLTCLLHFGFVHLVSSQCCSSYKDSQCQKCPPGTFLFEGNCIIAKNMCTKYNALDCAMCVDGYSINDRGNCIKDNQVAAYSFLTQSQFTSKFITKVSDLTIQKVPGARYLIDGAILTNFDLKNISANITKQFLRLVYLTDNGYTEATISVVPSSVSNNPQFRTSIKQSITIKAEERPVDLSKDPGTDRIRSFLSSVGLGQPQNRLTGGFKAVSSVRSTGSKYTLITFNADQGITQTSFQA